MVNLLFQEFKFLRSQRHDSDTLMINSTYEAEPDQGFFDKYNIGSPFDAQMDEEDDEDVLDSNDVSGYRDFIVNNASITVLLFPGNGWIQWNLWHWS